MHALVALKPTSSRSPRADTELIWDLRFSPTHSRLTASPRYSPSSSSTTQFATAPALTSLRIRCGLFPFDEWTIHVQNPQGVTVDDVFAAIYKNLRRGVSKVEWDTFTRTQQTRVAEAFYERSRRSSDPKHEHNSGVRRIDFLLKNTTFIGLSPSLEEAFTWNLVTGRRER